MNLKTSQKGFTIVELLIVIVVIAILAAISIVAYVGIQNNARASEYQSDATNIAKVAETYLASEGSYPTIAQLSAGSNNAKLPANVKVQAAASQTATATNTGHPAKDATTGEKTYSVVICTTASDGGKVLYWDPSKNTSKAVVYGKGC